MTDEQYDAVVVGTGFASTFFLGEYLKHAPDTARVLVLEKGRRYPYSWKLEHRANTDHDFASDFVNRTPQKPWVQNIAFGGGACWTGNTPRQHPSDFETKTRYGVGDDWPFDYAELEPYYAAVESIMGISTSEDGPWPRSTPAPAPPHAINGFDRLFAKKYPGQYLPMPTARSSALEKTGRPNCCANGVCATCPLGVKFQVDLHYTQPYADPRVTLRTEAPVDRVDIEAGRVTGVFYTRGGREQRAACDLATVGAHAIMTPHVLLRSGLDDPALGKYLNEQIGIDVVFDLDGVDSFDGGQAISGLGMMFYDGDFRRERAGCLIEGWNLPWMRAERGRWRQRGNLKFVFEDLPEPEKRVELDRDDPTRPAVTYAKYSDYMQRGMDHLPRLIEELIEGLPIENYAISPRQDLGSSAHIQGTTRMGTDPATSVLDGDLRHHKVRNLLALGSGTFPTCPAANPTLTLSALSVRAARRLFTAT